MDPNAVTAARLVIYFPKVTKPGNLTLTANDNPGFSEVFSTPTIATPPSAGTIGSPIAVIVADSKNFLTIPVTEQVISWLTNASTDFGFGISADSPTSTVNVLIGSKECSGSGYPAVLEVDVNDSGTGTISGGSATFTGPVGIGTTTPTAKLKVNGGIKCIGAVDTSSDARYKMNIAPISSALDKTLRLRGVSYDWNRAAFPDKGFNDRHQLGFIAQEVRAIHPDVVSEDADGYLSIGYTAIIPVLTEAIRELKEQKDTAVAALQASNAALAQKLTALEARDQAREARLTRLEAQLAPQAATARTVALTAGVAR